MGRAEPLSAIFALLAFQVYHPLARSSGAALKATLVGLLGTVALFYAAIISKETAFPVIVMIAIWDFVENVDDLRLIFSRRRLSGSASRLLLRVFVLGMAAVGYLMFRRVLTVHFTVMNYRRVENPIAFAPELLTRFLSMVFAFLSCFAFDRALMLPIQISSCALRSFARLSLATLRGLLLQLSASR